VITEILIVGQGLAGTTLALQLHQAGIPFLLVDEPTISHSSRVAAGLFNPVVFRRMNLGWRTDECLPEAISFYRSIEALLGKSFCHPIGLHRIHGSDDERQLWATRMLEDGWGDHIESSEPSSAKPWFKQPFGGAPVHSAGFVSTLEYLDAARTWLKDQNLLIEEPFLHDDLDCSKPLLCWKDVQCTEVVFCEGYKLNENPWFPEVYLNPAKGELLIIEAPDLPQEIFNGKVYGVPLGNNQFRVGSTYSWNDKDAEPTEKKKQELINILDQLLNVPFKVLDHFAGIRPTVTDRRPVFGPSSLHPDIYTFNGLGTKGVVLAPLLAKEISQYFLNGTPVPEDYAIERFQWKPLH
jgi:glycine/D-amino acid oxidase-like deaminating enzyme